MSDEQEIKINEAAEVEPAENDSVSESINELREPNWSVVSFKERVAKNLTYDEALRKMLDLQKQKISGLCIITDEAAARI